jgi:hypothetical protein
MHTNYEQCDDVRLLRCKNVWPKDHKELTHLLTYEVKYKSGKIEHVRMTADTPFPLRYFEINEGSRFSDYEQLIQYLHLSTPKCDRILIKDVKVLLIKEADPVDMTVEEIEAALGKKIKIVSKED